MRVRIQRTCSVESTGRGGLPARGVYRRQVLTVGGGYDLPDEVAKDLVARGLATRVEAYEKPDPAAARDGRRARAEIERLVRENGAVRSQLAELDDELATAREEIARLRAAAEGARAAVEHLEVTEVAGADADADAEDEPEDAAGEAEPESELAEKPHGRGGQAKAEESATQE